MKEEYISSAIKAKQGEKLHCNILSKPKNYHKLLKRCMKFSFPLVFLPV